MNLNHEKLQFFGIYEILKETITLIFTPTTIFAQIALAFILPLSLLIFTQSTHSPPFNSLRSFFSAIFFFLSTSTAVYAAACIHADHDVSFRQVIAAAPKVCKRHFITFLCLLADLLAFNFFAVSAILLIFVISFLLNYERFEIFKAALILFLSAAAVYFALIWQIASVVSVFETEAYGFEAIARSKELIEGKMAIGYLPVELKVEDDDDYEKPSTGHDTV
ncbi:uncharacterized protein LOC111443242 [Cucurbita moschata]|uniref:Uncharacterized protein LOC111443242 n=1 Tax=Cucurbita moschata TaxID=3662 RepID=A0A6J1FE29_CUCMO|nr:uncharacterized protein LOC111443242 [Cucurbita moschata]